MFHVMAAPPVPLRWAPVPPHGAVESPQPPGAPESFRRSPLYLDANRSRIRIGPTLSASPHTPAISIPCQLACRSLSALVPSISLAALSCAVGYGGQPDNLSFAAQRPVIRSISSGYRAPLHCDLRGGAVDVTEIVRGKLDGGCSDVLLDALELRGTWDGNYPRLLGK
jgi:hypothetical protein